MNFYFGTSSCNLEKIKVQGLINPCITDNYDLASYYASLDSEKNGGVVVIFQINLEKDDMNYSYKENRKFKYKGKILPCNIKMIEGPEFKQELYAEEVISLINKHHTNSDEILSGKFNTVFDYDKYRLAEIDLNIISHNHKVDKALIKEYLFLNLDECPPIVLILNKKNKLEIIDGFHRFETFKLAKKSKIKAYVPVI